MYETRPLDQGQSYTQASLLLGHPCSTQPWMLAHTAGTIQSQAAEGMPRDQEGDSGFTNKTDSSSPPLNHTHLHLVTCIRASFLPQTWGRHTLSGRAQESDFRSFPMPAEHHLAYL